MSAEEMIRRYLEQRREMGEKELVLDRMSIEEAMRILGAASGRAPLADQAPAPARAAPTDAFLSRGRAPDIEGDWRAALSAAGASPVEASRAPLRPSAGTRTGDVTPPAPIAPPPTPALERSPSPPSPSDSAASAAGRIRALAPAGIVVGGGGPELFGGPLSEARTLGELDEMIRHCTRCPLYATATNPVPGEGSPTASLMCIGEAPGATEDETGRPFVGQAGQLLTKILEAINLRREDVFIANVLKHRPPGNRNPALDEVQACSPYLVRQVELIRPKVILALGNAAAQTLLDTTLGIGKLRGVIHWYHGTPLVVTYHPAALLRNPNWKRPTWEDVQLARRILDRVAA